MSVRLIRLLALAIAIVLPIQGMAAVTLGQCMALGHHQPAEAHEGNGLAQDGADDHHDAGPSHSHSDEAGNKVDGDESGSKGSHCGPCTGCCAAASIAGAVGVLIPSSPSEAPDVFAQLPPPGVQPGGLYRPPLAL